MANNQPLEFEKPIAELEKKIEELMAKTPADACNTWRALAAGVAKFTDDLMNHIHLENNVLFPAFEKAGAPHEGCGCGHQH